MLVYIYLIFLIILMIILNILIGLKWNFDYYKQLENECNK